MTKVMYLGRHEWYEPKNDYDGNYSIALKGKKHIFINLEGRPGTYYNKYILQTGFTKLASKTSDTALPQFAKEYDLFKKSMNNSPGVEVKVKKKPLSLKRLETNYYRVKRLMKEGDNYYVVSICKVRSSYNSKVKADIYTLEKSRSTFSLKLNGEGICYVPGVNNNSYYGKCSSDGFNLTKEELLTKEFYTALISNGKGGLYDVISN